ncbi:hypothetical protein BJY00DRAFT_319805 [Aspergillus carlsbadensis]|nr:hypothetical protein BJY00DRAFT_319805 [Aspergillus carlsbadensis]
MEGPGNCPVWGYNKKIGPLPAALLNSTQIQGFEIDDWHSLAPVHSNAIVLPALLAAAAHARTQGKSFSGYDLLLATIAGYETGPRVGLSLHGSHMLSWGWHSGAVFGHAQAAAAVGKLLGLPEERCEEDAAWLCGTEWAVWGAVGAGGWNGAALLTRGTREGAGGGLAVGCDSG